MMKGISTRHLSALATSLLLAGCGGGGGGGPLADPAESSFTVNHAFGQIADGTSLVTFEVTVADAEGHPIPGLDLVFHLTGTGNELRHDTVTDENGEARGELATRVAESKTLTCFVGSARTRSVLGELEIEFVRRQENAYYLRTDGSDASDGRTPIDAWRSLDHALTQLGAGETLYIGAGEYPGGWSYSVQAPDSSPVTILGDREGVHTGDAGEVVVLGGGMDHALELAGAANVTLRGLTLRGSDPGIGLHLRGATRNIRVVDCDLYESERGIVTEIAEGLLIESTRITNHTVEGIVLGETLGTRILQSLVYNNTSSGIVLAGPSTDILIQGNTFFRNGGDHLREDRSGGTGTVTSNVFAEGGSFSVRLLGGSSFTRANNLVFANQGDPGSSLDLEADPLFANPFGEDGLLGGAGAADDDFRVLSSSPGLDAGLTSAADTILPFTGPASTRTTRTDELADGTGADGSAVNLGYHYPLELDPLHNLPPGTGRLAFATEGEAFVHSRTLDAAGNWGEDSTTHTANQGVKWIVNRARSGEQPDEAQAVLVDTGATAQLFVRTWDGRLVSEDFTHPMTTHIRSGDTDERGFDIEFESVSGDLLFVQGGPAANPLYRVWREGAWSDEQSVFDLELSPSTLLWVQLVPRAGTDEIALVTLDDQMRIIASVWDGESWSPAHLLGTEVVENRGFRAFDAAWESLSGDLLVAWGFDVFSEETRYATRDGQSGAWTTGHFASTEAIAAHLRMASDPTSDRIIGIFGEGTFDDDITASIWNGEAWSDTIEFTLDGFSGSRSMQAAWLGDSGEAIAVYREGDLNGDLNYAIFDDGGWRVFPQIFLPGPGRILQAEILQRGDSDGVSILQLDQAGNLYEILYENETWSLGNDGAALATNLDTANPGRAFSMARRGH